MPRRLQLIYKWRLEGQTEKAETEIQEIRNDDPAFVDCKDGENLFGTKMRRARNDCCGERLRKSQTLPSAFLSRGCLVVAKEPKRGGRLLPPYPKTTA